MNNNHKYIIKMPDEAPVPDFGLGYECFHSLKKHSDKIAQYMEDTGESQTFGDLFEKSVKIAINLRKFGISDDEIVCLCVENRKYSVVPYIASVLIGKLVSAIDPDMIPEEKASVLEKMRPKIIFVDDTKVNDLKHSLKLAEMDNVELIVMGNETFGHRSFDEFLQVSEYDFNNFEPTKVDNDRTAIIFFSSGTTGVPKGVCLSHTTLLTRSLFLTLPTCLIFCKLNWISFAVVVFGCIRNGNSRVVMKEFDVERFWKAVEKYRIESIFCPTYHVSALVNWGIPENLDVSCFDLLLCGGSALPEEVFIKSMKTLPGIRVMQGYGLTELGGPGLMFGLDNPEHEKWHLTKTSSCGTTIKGIWYKVVDPDTEEILGPNKPGELRLKSKLVMKGYYNMDSSSYFDSDGWYKTGDIVQYDEDLCFYVVDRISDFIKYKGLEISSTALEHVLLKHPAVDKAAVVGIPHKEDGNIPVGLVTLKGGCAAVSPVEIQQFVDERVKEREKLRGGLKIIKEIPITSTGKMQKRVLKKKLINNEI